MSYEKARDLIELAVELTGQRVGMSLDDIEERFGASRRTAQRVTRLLEEMFDAETRTDDETGKKYWFIPSVPMKELVNVSDDELATLKLAKDLMEKKGHADRMKHLISLDNKVRSLLPKNSTRIINNAEDLMVAQGFATRKGPKVMVNDDHLNTLKHALQACQKVKLGYAKSPGSNTPPRTLSPYGILYGIRPYLVAFEEGDTSRPKSFRLDRIESLELLDECYERDETFDLNDHARKGYGSFISADEVEEIVWKFSPAAANNARAYQFHPDQVQEDQPDGSLIVRFEASGLLEMAWDLYRWGRHVEVIAPKALRDMIKGHQRDFEGMP